MGPYKTTQIAAQRCQLRSAAVDNASLQYMMPHRNLYCGTGAPQDVLIAAPVKKMPQ